MHTSLLKRDHNNIVSINPYEEGKRAFRSGSHWNECPYAHMALSPHVYMWTCGWDDASVEILTPATAAENAYLPRSPAY